jgi:hypothetical protein
MVGGKEDEQSLLNGHCSYSVTGINCSEFMENRRVLDYKELVRTGLLFSLFDDNGLWKLELE